MDHIAFTIHKSKVEDYLVTDIIVNGYYLRDWIGRLELPYTQAEGQESLAGAYEGLPPLLVLPPNRHFWGHPLPAYRHGPHTAVLEYGRSGIPGDWTLACRIAVDGESVQWSDFYQLKRPQWDYSALGTLCFDLVQYRDALQHARRQAYGSGRAGERESG